MSQILRGVDCTHILPNNQNNCLSTNLPTVLLNIAVACDYEETNPEVSARIERSLARSN